MREHPRTGAIAPDPTRDRFRPDFAAADLRHWFGTDDLGRDILARVAAGRMDLEIAPFASLLPFLIGSPIGAVSAYFGGLVDLRHAVRRYHLGLPLLRAGHHHRGLARAEHRQHLHRLLARGLDLLCAYRARRGIPAAQLEYIQAASVLGYSHIRIVLRHLMPNVITPALVFVMSDVILTILAVTSLGFLGLGIQPPKAEWGVMIAEGRNFIYDAWWITLFPGLAIIFVGIAFALMATALTISCGQSHERKARPEH